MGSSHQRDPRLSRHTRDYASLDELVGAAEAAQALVDLPGWAVLMALLDAEIGEIDRQLDGGRVLDSKSEYAHLCGRRSGLKAAPALLTALVERAESKLDEQRRKHEGAAEPALEGVT